MSFLCQPLRKILNFESFLQKPPGGLFEDLRYVISDNKTSRPLTKGAWAMPQLFCKTKELFSKSSVIGVNFKCLL